MKRWMTRGVATRGVLLAALALAVAIPLLAQAPGPDYGEFNFLGLDRRGAVWIAAQLHLLFAAFVLGVPMFAVVIAAIGRFGGDE
ncbi:MAG: hypothetical protein F4Z59_05745, partial [Gemmatimonadales bacterium]|nr:hypothetical protein [Gemmatimonadales bacterium]